MPQYTAIGIFLKIYYMTGQINSVVLCFVCFLTFFKHYAAHSDSLQLFLDLGYFFNKSYTSLIPLTKFFEMESVGSLLLFTPQNTAVGTVILFSALAVITKLL